jgi:solute:Na+ symporter, SSS family
MIDIIIISCYLSLLLGLGLVSNKYFRGTSEDFFVASHSIGPVLLLMSVFGTTMTAFAMVGSTGEAYANGIGVYGMMASWSGLIHSAVFFVIGIKLWSFGKKHNYMTQIQFFRDRFESSNIGLVLFPVLVGLVIPYLLIGILGAGSVMQAVTKGTLPGIFPETAGAVPPWLTGFVICSVVLTYVFFGGLRAAAWANTFQTIVFMIMGGISFYIIASKLGGASEAIKMANPQSLVREGNISQLQFFSYCFVPLSVGMFPHLFQHWLTAKTAKTFRLTVIVHPIFIMIVWVPCILIGVWATGAMIQGIDGTMVRVIPEGTPANAVLGIMVNKLAGEPLAGFLTAGILAAIMSSLDSQFMCVGTMFTNDIAIHYWGRKRFSEKQIIWLARVFIIGVVLVTYLFSLMEPRRVFTLGIWCFSGFSGLFPLVFAAVYWRRATKIGAYACILATAASWFYFFRDSGYGAHTEYLVFGMMPVAVICVVSALTMYLVSIVTPRLSEDTLIKFFPKNA